MNDYQGPQVSDTLLRQGLRLLNQYAVTLPSADLRTVRAELKKLLTDENNTHRDDVSELMQKIDDLEAMPTVEEYLQGKPPLSEDQEAEFRALVKKHGQAKTIFDWCYEAVTGEGITIEEIESDEEIGRGT